jgi:serine/threonine protein phosphatase PrpC
VKFRLKCAVFTDKGDREINEDSVGVFENDGNSLCVLCDGLGGHGMGDVASSLVVKVFESQFSKNIKPEKFLSETFMASQDILLAEQKARNAERKMKTTGVALITNGKNAYIGHVGDSRLYVFSKNTVKQRTLDHSIPQMLVLSGELKESEIRNHPDRCTILRVLGIEWDEPMFQLMSPLPLRKCQAFLLCSDGFWELIEEETMCSLLEKASDPEEWLSEMQKTVKANGRDKNMDNYSAIAAWTVKE